MEWALNEYTYRECCGKRIRECDDCDCYECETCGEFYQQGSSESDCQCNECYTYNMEEEW